MSKVVWLLSIHQNLLRFVLFVMCKSLFYLYYVGVLVVLSKRNGGKYVSIIPRAKILLINPDKVKSVLVVLLLFCCLFVCFEVRGMMFCFVLP